jgi:hypothetical protein
LENKPIKNYVLYSYLKNCIFTPPHLNVGRTKLSLNKYKGRKFGSFINYNKIIEYKFNSTFYHPLPPSPKGREGVIRSDHSPYNSLREGANITSILREEISAKARGKVPSFEVPSYQSTPLGVRGNTYIKDTYKLLFYFFKSMYCLISKPVLKYTNDKVTIQLFYYLNIPKKKVFRLFSIFYINSIKKKWLAQSHPSFGAKQSQRFSSPLLAESQKGFSPASSAPLPSLPLGEGGRASTPLVRGGSLAPPSPKGREEAGSLGGLLRKGGGKRVNFSKIYIRWKLRKAISRFKNKNIKNLLFKLRKFNLTKVFQNKFKFICAILSNKFNKPVELQLIRLHHPYHDSNILVNLLSLNIKNKRKKARVAVQKIYNKKPVKILNDPNLKSGKYIPAFLSGLNIKIAGRLMGEPIIPRITTKVFGKGASATGKVNYLDVARITKKNKKGAYTLKITSGQNFF